MTLLPVSRLINVSASLAPQGAVGKNFSNTLMIGDSNIISGLERIRFYGSIGDVGADFGSTTPEFLAAEVYFGQSPQPTQMSIGRWLRTATAAQNLGRLLTASQSALANFTSITSGGFTIVIDGASHALTGLDFSAATNLNAVAGDVTTALSTYGVCVWNGSQFSITSDSTGAGVSASGTITFSTAPTAADTVTINGVAITFVTGTPSGNQVLIGGTAATSAVNLNTFLQASSNASLAVLSYSVAGAVVTVTEKTVGTAGNSITLAKSSTALSLSASTLLGGLNASSVGYATSPGSGQDVSALLGLTAATSVALIPGYAAETPLAAVVALDAISNAWYGSMFAASVMPSDNDNLSIASFIEAADLRLFAVTIQNTNVLSSLVSNDLASELKALGVVRTFDQYSSSNPYAGGSIYGRMSTVNFLATNTAIDLMYKQEPTIVAEQISSGQANTLQTKRCNAFVAYDNGTNIIQYGVMAGPQFIDETFNIDWVVNSIQTAVFNVNYTSSSKIPQTDAGNNQYLNAISQVCDQAVANGISAPGVWNQAGFGSLQEGQFLKLGYYVFIPSVATQSESDRAARKAPPIQVAIKFAGSTQTVDVLLFFNR